MQTAGSVISTILKHDKKQNTYKIALFRAINDVIYSYPNLYDPDRRLAIPLRSLGAYWIAYYWPFCLPHNPIIQGNRHHRYGKLSQDMAFRKKLTALVEEWDGYVTGKTKPSDGYFLMNELRTTGPGRDLPDKLYDRYDRALTKVKQSIKQPIRYSGSGEWDLFDKPERRRELDEDRNVVIPQTKHSESCLVIEPHLWNEFQKLSMWVEALAIHEWCLFTEEIQANDEMSEDAEYDPQQENLVAENRPAYGSSREKATRGDVYELLTDRPDNRRPLTWERNYIELIMQNGRTFHCPWSHEPIRAGDAYDVDHIIPISIYPTNELWNLVPAKPNIQRFQKKDKLPSMEKLEQAVPRLKGAYENYMENDSTKARLLNDVQSRFLFDEQSDDPEPEHITSEVVEFTDRIGEMRNMERF